MPMPVQIAVVEEIRLPARGRSPIILRIILLLMNRAGPVLVLLGTLVSLGLVPHGLAGHSIVIVQTAAGGVNVLYAEDANAEL